VNHVVLFDVIAAAAAVDLVRATQSNFSRSGAVLRGWKMSHVGSVAARSTSVDISHHGCILRLLVHCSLIHCHSRYELHTFYIVQLIC